MPGGKVILVCMDPRKVQGWGWGQVPCEKVILEYMGIHGKSGDGEASAWWKGYHRIKCIHGRPVILECMDIHRKSGDGEASAFFSDFMPVSKTIFGRTTPTSKNYHDCAWVWNVLVLSKTNPAWIRAVGCISPLQVAQPQDQYVASGLQRQWFTK